MAAMTKAVTSEQKRAWWMGLMGLVSLFISFCLRVWSKTTHHHVHYWIDIGFEALGLLGMGFFTWARYHDPNTPYK